MCNHFYSLNNYRNWLEQPIIIFSAQAPGQLSYGPVLLIKELPCHPTWLQCLWHCKNIPLIEVVCQLGLHKTSHATDDTSASSEDIFSGGGDTIVSSTTEKWLLGGDCASKGAGILSKSS